MQNRLQFTGLLARTSLLYKMKINALMAAKHINLSSEMCGVLVELWKGDGKSQQELADTLHKDKGGMTKIIKSLNQRELVTRSLDENDRRRKKIKLTQKGQLLQQEVEPLMNTLRQTALENISSEDLKNTEKILNTIVGNLNKTL